MALHAVDRMPRAAPARAVEAQADELRQHRLAERAEPEHADAPLAGGPHGQRAPLAFLLLAPVARHVAMQAEHRMRHVLDHAAHDAGLHHAHHRQCGGSAAKSNWSTPAPEENRTFRFGKRSAIRRRLPGREEAHLRRVADVGPDAKSISGARRRNTSAHWRPRTGSDL